MKLLKKKKSEMVRYQIAVYKAVTSSHITIMQGVY